MRNRSMAILGLLCAWLFHASLGAGRAAGGSEPERVRAGLAALYDFADTEGDVVADRSEIGTSLDLEVRDPEAVRRTAGALEVVKPTMVRSPGRADKICNTVRISEEITLEAWFRSAEAKTRASETILALSPASANLNFVLMQDGDVYDVRFRTTRTGTDGLPSVRARAVTAPTELTHFVYTRDRTGRTRVFLNGQPVLEQVVAGSMSGWERVSFSLANELNGASPWLGTYYLVAVYSRDLLSQEVEQNFRAGPDYRAAKISSVDEGQGSDLFAAKIAPLLASKCLECHESAVKSGGLDLTHEESALDGGSTGPALTPGDADASRLVELVEQDKMPLGRAPLLKAEKALLREWVEMGAPWTLDKIDLAEYAEPEVVTREWVRRLTATEYVKTVQSVFGVDIAKEAGELLPPDQRADGFRNTAYNLTVDLGHVEGYARLARMIVERMDRRAFIAEYSDRRSLEDAQLEKLIARIGADVMRAPLEEDELSLYKTLVSAVVSAGGDFEDVVRYVLEAMLQSPRFLYRVENQRGDGSAWPVGEYELASRMSYILWGAAPDAELVAAAEAGKLRDPAEFRSHIERMLADPRAIERSSQFISEWLDLDRLGNLQPNRDKFPTWDPRIAHDMREETLVFFREVVWEQQRPLTDLLNAQFTYATPRLAEHYGLEPRGEGLARYDLSSTPSRGGLLTQGSVLTIGGDEASMVTRGLFVLEELLDGEVGSPPPGLDTTPPPTSPGRSNRAIAMERVESPSCGGCHARFEPLAFGLEKFDGIGAYRETDRHGNALREDGEILIPGESEPIRYQVAAEMMDLLAASDRLKQTLTRKLAQFAIGRPPAAYDEDAIESIQRQSSEGGFTYRALVTAILESDLVQRTKTEPIPGLRWGRP